MIEFGLAELAENFWKTVGDHDNDLETAIVLSLPIVPASIGRLTVYKALNWLSQRGVNLAGLESVRDRALRACLVACGGQRNYILWDNTDSAADQLFSLAHELAHFLLDFEQPRQKAIRYIGPRVLDVFDGARPATLQERLHGVLEGVRVKPQHHFMERGKQGDILSSQVLEIENRADQLALEILAPEERALALLEIASRDKAKYSQRLQAAEAVLVSQFGLASSLARPYATQLLSQLGIHQKFDEWLKS